MPRRSHDSGFIRLNKLLAGKGVASRRHVEEMIIAGRIRVDGELATEKGLKVRPNAQIEVDGHVVGQPPPLAWVALHKPRGYVCTKEDSRDRPIVMDLLPPELSHLHPVGRLDGDVSGLLLFKRGGTDAPADPPTVWDREGLPLPHHVTDEAAASTGTGGGD